MEHGRQGAWNRHYLSTISIDISLACHHQPMFTGTPDQSISRRRSRERSMTSSSSRGKTRDELTLCNRLQCGQLRLSLTIEKPKYPTHCISGRGKRHKNKKESNPPGEKINATVRHKRPQYPTCADLPSLVNSRSGSGSIGR